MNSPAPSVQIVAIGASAGGLDALKEFFNTMPSDCGLAFVVIQHLDPNHQSHMAELLAKCTTMKVVEAADGQPVEANSVYTIPSGRFLSVKEGLLRSSDPVKSDGIRLPIDFFLRSLAQDQQDKAIAVLLSGSGSDGTLGIREVSGTGGVVLVQDPASAQFDSMIQSAIATGRVDSVLPLPELAGALLEYVRQGRVDLTDGDGEAVHDYLGSIVSLLAGRTNNDFRYYKSAMLQRRVARRMAIQRFTRVSEYYRMLEENLEELDRLAKDLLIGVTHFFRDPEAFAELGEKVLRPLVDQWILGRPLRVWCVGCSTGEEAYSLAIEMMDEISRGNKKIPLQIFASDIDSDALKFARDGCYPENIAADVSAERLAHYFTKKDAFYQIDRVVRDTITFARHNVISDPPFMKLDLISCRNVLIYIDAEMQKKLLSLFAFALNPGGYLFLGKSDTSGDQSDAFEQVSRPLRILRRKQSVAVQVGNFPSHSNAPVIYPLAAARRAPIGLAELNQQVLLKHFNASIVLVDEYGTIQHFYGPSHQYLQHPFGDATLSVFDLINQRYSMKLRQAVQNAASQNVTVKLGAIDFGRDKDSRIGALTVMPVSVALSRPKLLAIIFESVAGLAREGDAPLPVESGGQGDDQVAQLESEIFRIKEELRSSTDSFQSTHEELTAANEEILAINEELQSTNEELETSKEEMQSINEELITVNDQLTTKVEELSRTNDDLANFLNSSEVGTIFLDGADCIRRFTPSTTRLVNVMAVDVGRPVSNISTNLVDVDLTAVAREVIQKLTPIEKEVTALDGRWYMMRCLPYRTLDNHIDGTVFTFTDVTGLKQSTAALLEAKNYAENVLNSTPVALVVLNRELKVLTANRAFYETFQVTPEETANQQIFELGNGQWDNPRLRKLLSELARENMPFSFFEVEHDFPRIGSKLLSLNAKIVRDDANEGGRWILLTINDLTKRREAERELRLSNERLSQVFEGAPIAMILVGKDGKINRLNSRVVQLFGYNRDELVGKAVEILVPERYRSALPAERDGFFARPRVRAMGSGGDLYARRKDGSEVPVEIGLSPISFPEGVFVMASIIDITERSRMLEALRLAKDQLTEVNEQLEIRVAQRTTELAHANSELLQDIATRKRLEDQLRHAQKLETIGTMAAGIAHDFNNILNIIGGYSAILQPHAKKNREIAESLDSIATQVRRGAALSHQLLTIGRKTEGKVESTDINLLLRQQVGMLRETFPKSIEIKLVVNGALPQISVDPDQVNQLLLNLCVNARDAMPDGGHLTIGSEIVGAQSLPDGCAATAAQYISIEIRDSGTGIDESVRARLFEPFITTKEFDSDSGSGLGLAVVYGIVQSHNGFIDVDSKPREGSTFRIFLPVASAS